MTAGGTASVEAGQERPSGAVILAITGMRREASCIERDGVWVVVSGGDQRALAERLAAALEALGGEGAAGIISIGLAGGLDPSLKPGDGVLAEAVVAGERRIASDGPWTRRLRGLLPNARPGVILGRDEPVLDPLGRRRLFRATGAICVDMESHAAVLTAEAKGLPFAALRFISDGADRTLPKAALAGLRPDGSLSLAAVLAALARNPLQLPALIRTGVEAEAAFKALFRDGGRLGATLGLGDV